MDYSTGTALYKYQWGLIHDPETTTGLMDGMEEAAMVITDNNPILRGFFASIRKYSASKSPYFSRVLDYVVATKDFF